MTIFLAQSDNYEHRCKQEGIAILTLPVLMYTVLHKPLNILLEQWGLLLHLHECTPPPFVMRNQMVQTMQFNISSENTLCLIIPIQIIISQVVSWWNHL